MIYKPSLCREYVQGENTRGDGYYSQGQRRKDPGGKRALTAEIVPYLCKTSGPLWLRADPLVLLRKRRA